MTTYTRLFDDAGRFCGVVSCLDGTPSVMSEADFDLDIGWGVVTPIDEDAVYTCPVGTRARAEEIKTMLEEDDDGEWAGLLEVRERDRVGEVVFDVVRRDAAA